MIRKISSAIFTAALIAGVASPCFSLAQQSTTPPAAQESGTPQAPARGERMLALYAEKLSLTEEQKQQIKPILEERQQSLRDLRSDHSSRRMKKRREMKSIMEESDRKIKAVLTADQQKKFDDLQKEMREQMRARMKNGGQAGQSA